MNQGQIMTLGFMGPDFFLQYRKCSCRFSRHHNAGRVLVQPVHNARTDGILAGRKNGRSAVIQEPIGQRTVRISKARMHHHAPGLINHNHILILIENLKGQVLGHQSELLLFFPGKGNFISRFHMVIGPQHFARGKESPSLLHLVLHL